MSNASAINVKGTGIVIEAGQGFLGSSAAPVTVDVLSGGSLTLRALDSIYVTAPVSDIPVDCHVFGVRRHHPCQLRRDL